MTRRLRCTVLVTAATLLTACAGKRIQVPPRLDLTRYPTVGLLTFTVGAEYRMPVVFVGYLTVSDVTPRGELAGLRLPRVEATVDAELTVRLLSTESGATVWPPTGRAREQVGEVGLVNGTPFFSAEHPDEAYSQLIDRLIVAVTHDLRPTWRRQ